MKPKAFATWTTLVCAEGVAKLGAPIPSMPSTSSRRIGFISAAGGFLDVIYISWMLLAGYSRYAISTFFYAVAGAGAAAAFGFCVFLRCTHGYGRHVIAAIALCTFPPTAIGSLAAFSSQAPTHVDLYADLRRDTSTYSDFNP